MKRLNVLVETFESCPDLRIAGSNIYIGKKAAFHVKGKNQHYKIYMTNTGKSITYYIKLKGRNYILISDAITEDMQMTPYKLNSLEGWFIVVDKAAQLHIK
jgi:hypothetical protein